MNEDKAHYAPVDPFSAGLRGQCPRCGQGRLFDGFLALKDRCPNCGLGYDFADAGDGPAVFVIMIIGFVVLGLALWMDVTLAPPLWMHFILWIPLALILCLGTLRPLKGVMIALQYKNNAHEGGIWK